MVEFLARRKKTKTRRPVNFKTRYGRVSFTARRRANLNILLIHRNRNNTYLI